MSKDYWRRVPDYFELYYRCRVCEIDVRWPQNKYSKYCSNACRQKAYRQRMRK